MHRQRRRSRRCHPYNPAMRSIPLCLLTALCWGPALAQTQPPGVPAPPAALQQQAAPGSAVEQRVERIRMEDDGSVVEEVRFGGQAQSITVSPKAPVPGYEIVPADGARSRALSRDALSAAPGQRVWNLLKF